MYHTIHAGSIIDSVNRLCRLLIEIGVNGAAHGILCYNTAFQVKVDVCANLL